MAGPLEIAAFLAAAGIFVIILTGLTILATHYRKK